MIKIGDQFGRWKVVGFAGEHGHNKKWNAQCSCGKFGRVFQSSLLSGCSKSCGCLHREISRRVCISRTKHGDSRRGKISRIRSIWGSIRRRCINPKVKAFANYGGRGIKICSEWNDYRVFKDWALRNGYQDGLTIDRINNDGDYEPRNCRWITLKLQSRNKRTTKVISYKGETKSVQEWAECIGISYKNLWARLKRWGEVEKCFLTPLRIQ